MRVAQVWAAHPKLSTAIDSQMQQLERAVLLLGQTIALSSMQATTPMAAMPRNASSVWNTRPSGAVAAPVIYRPTVAMATPAMSGIPLYPLSTRAMLGRTKASDATNDLLQAVSLV